MIYCFGSCNSCEEQERKYDVMTRQGIFQARIDDIRSKVKYIEQHYSGFTQHELDSAELALFDSEYPFWRKIHLYLKDNDLTRAKLYADFRKDSTTEEYYFDEGELIYALIEKKGLEENEPDSLVKGEQYFFIRQTLVLALDENGKRRALKDNMVAISGIDLKKEAEQLKALAANYKDPTP